MRTASGYAFLAALLSLTLRVRANFYLQDEWTGEQFLQGWNWETEDDPTHGRVNYLNQDEAQRKNLTYVQNGTFFMRADDWSIVSPSARGRDSMRISSPTAYNQVLIVLDVAHIPTGCGTWPAFWTLSKDGPWPNGGEIDIIEGIHQDIHNQATLHTSSNCKMPPDLRRQPQRGHVLKTDCDAAVESNAGCGVMFSDSDPSTPSDSGSSKPYTSLGDPFNLGRGGYFVMQKGPDGVKIWFFPRGRYVPLVIRDGVPAESPMEPNPSGSWGDPEAYFPFEPEFCDYAKHFDAHRIVFDLTFCGDWAGNTWAGSGCQVWGNSCNAFVDNKPSEFREAFWEINGLRVYTPRQWQ